ncbi:hypothetical protein LZ518_08560 [Sphingomonas sp. RB56-2]|uniref:EF-hand domain-containing protein n=1 Tax=Sphingomonas brevis TaxID=2908206 RepID=A0ABT0S9U0_9SPHN|nr:hypothetical protein [Sphingomonas brevis]MCL6741180.1 hypothetical protein [Sphingomonas brevis]
MSRTTWVTIALFGAMSAGTAHSQQKAAVAPAPAPAVQQPIARAQFIREMDTEFNKIDADKNRQLSRIEIDQFQKLQAIAQAQSRNRSLFAQLDADRNGQLSQAEFAKLTPPPPTAGAQQMLTRMDSNRDNQVSQIEYRASTLVNFDRLDADKDGYVSPAEMKAGGIGR